MLCVRVHKSTRPSAQHAITSSSGHEKGSKYFTKSHSPLTTQPPSVVAGEGEMRMPKSSTLKCPSLLPCSPSRKSHVSFGSRRRRETSITQLQSLLPRATGTADRGFGMVRQGPPRHLHQSLLPKLHTPTPPSAHRATHPPQFRRTTGQLSLFGCDHRP